MIQIVLNNPAYYGWEWEFVGFDKFTNFSVSNTSKFIIKDNDDNIVLIADFNPNNSNRLTWNGKDGYIYCVVALEDTKILQLGEYSYSIYVKSVLDDGKVLEDSGKVVVVNA